VGKTFVCKIRSITGREACNGSGLFVRGVAEWTSYSQGRIFYGLWLRNYFSIPQTDKPNEANRNLGAAFVIGGAALSESGLGAIAGVPMIMLGTALWAWPGSIPSGHITIMLTSYDLGTGPVAPGWYGFRWSEMMRWHADCPKGKKVAKCDYDAASGGDQCPIPLPPKDSGKGSGPPGW